MKKQMLLQLFYTFIFVKKKMTTIYASARKTTLVLGMHSVVKDSAVKAVLHQRQQRPAGIDNKTTQQKRSFRERRRIFSAASFIAATGLN